MKRRVLAGALAMLLIGSAVGCAGVGQGGTGASDKPKYEPLNYVMYEKEGSMYYSALNGSEDILVAKDEENESSGYFEYGVMTTLSDNQKRLFYLQKMEGTLFGGSLHYRDVLEDGSLSDANKIATEIDLYKISEDGNRVMYSKTENQGLYFYDVEKNEKEKLNDLSWYIFEISKDGKRGIYSIYESETDRIKGYEFELGSEPREIEVGYYEIIDAKEDLSSYYIQNDEGVYYKEFGKEAELLVKDVTSVAKFYDTGEFYYYQYDQEDTGVDVSELIIDDMYDEDQNIPAVESPAYPNQEDYADMESWDAALQAYNKQLSLSNSYAVKLIRDEIRKGIEGEEVFAINLSLHYYDGEKTNLVAEYLFEDIHNMYRYGNAEFIDDEPGVVFSAAFERKDKVKLSELEAYFDSPELIQQALNKTASLYYAKGAEVTRLIDSSELGGIDLDQIVFSENQKNLYLFHRDSDENEYDLYEFELGEDVQKMESLQENINAYPFYSFADGSLMTTKYSEEESWNIYEIYLDGEKIASRASVEWADTEKTEYVLLEEKADDTSENGTLVRYKNHEPKEIDTNVKMAFINTAGDLFYVKRFDDEEWIGDLYYFNNGEGELVSKRARYIDTELTYLDFAG